MLNRLRHDEKMDFCILKDRKKLAFRLDFINFASVICSSKVYKLITKQYNVNDEV